MQTGARYDGLADWYDTFTTSELGIAGRELVARVLGAGSGTLLDIGCGTGAHSAALAELGWTVTGVDVSEDQLAGEGIPALYGGYRTTGRYDEGPSITPAGLRAKVGATHLPLGLFLSTCLDAGLSLEHIEEPGERAYPYQLALRWRR